MEGKQTNQNPFAALFPSLEKAEDYRKQHEFSATLVQTDHKHEGDTVMEAETVKLSMKKIHGDSKRNASAQAIVDTVSDEEEKAWILNDFLQRVFLITVDNGTHNNNLLYIRAANNGWSTDNVRSKIGFGQSNP